MKVHLLYRRADFDPAAPLPANEADLVADLGLRPVLQAMSGGDEFLAEVSRRVLLCGLAERDEIRYRQAILADCLDHAPAVHEMYGIACGAIEAEKRIWMDAHAKHPGGLLQRSIELLGTFFQSLERLRRIAEQSAPTCRSEGMKTLFAMLVRELDDEYLHSVQEQLARLSFREGVLSTASLGEGNFGTDYVLRRRREKSWLETVVGDRSARTFEVDERDMKAAETLSQLRDRGVAIAASALGKSTDHVLSFFAVLRFELAFYVACLNLRDRLVALDEPIWLPETEPAESRRFSCRGLYDVSLALTMGAHVAGNEVRGDGKSLCLVTGAHHGGKSTFLRSVGLAQLMMQAGMFVPAERFAASVGGAIYTHYRREEDPSMTSGKLDEELARMSSIVDVVRPNDVILFNDSFASTNEREGSEIARQIVRALTESGIRVCYVTHLYDLAHGFWRSKRDDTLFLRAERLADGKRTFRLVEAEPLPTSHGEDLYRRVFGGSPVVGAADAHAPAADAHAPAADAHAVPAVPADAHAVAAAPAEEAAAPAEEAAAP
jgi:DNA mismatch repair ATPase MutS